MKLTQEELRRKVAELQGWTGMRTSSMGVLQGVNPADNYYDQVPFYYLDATEAMRLLLGLDYAIYSDTSKFRPMEVRIFTAPRAISHAMTLEEAACLAYVELKTGERLEIADEVTE